MGFKQPNLNPAYQAIGQSITEITSPLNDGFTGMSCKQDLYMLKCYLDDAYASLPKFAGEEIWEQERLLRVLKKGDK
jgi:hypothetical protein